MSLTGGKRKVNKSLKAWVAFVKKVQKEEKLSYKDAIHRAKVRKDKGEKWMKGGADDDEAMEVKEKKQQPLMNQMKELLKKLLLWKKKLQNDRQIVMRYGMIMPMLKFMTQMAI